MVARRDEPGAGHAPRLARRAVAAGQRDRVQVPDAREARQVAEQQLAAPHRAVGAVPGAVEDRPDRRRRLAVLGQHGGEVRVVVLHADVARRPRARARRRSTGSRGAGRGRRRAGATSKSASKCATPSREGAQRLGGAQVADVVADPRARAAGQAERALQLGAAREHGLGAGDRQRERRGHQAARAAQELRRAGGRSSARPSRRCGCGSRGRARARRRRSPARRARASSSV